MNLIRLPNRFYQYSTMSIKITKVLLLDNVDPAAKEILESNGIEAVLSKEKFSGSGLISELQSYDGLVVRSATKVNDEIIKACPKLQIIGRAGTGVDNIDVKAATRHGVAVMNTPGGNTISAAEHTCTLICCLARNVPAADAHVKAGKWDRKAFMGHELFGKVLAIIGLGRIGLEVAQRMQSFGMKTIGFDPLVSVENAKKYNVDWMELDEIWPRADYITLHTPLIPQTRGLINSEVFAVCKAGVRVINCARGGIIDEDCLLKALESGNCGGAGLDVFVDEPIKNTDLANHSKVVACPHLGASTKEGQARCGREIAQQFINATTNKSFFGIINAPALTTGGSEGAEAWTKVAKNLATVLKQYVASIAKYNVSVYTSGPALAVIAKCIKAAICSGLVGDQKANLINASMLIEELGVQVSLEHRIDKEDSITLKVSSENDAIELKGSVTSEGPSLMCINGEKLSLPVLMSGQLLIYKARSMPNKMCEVIESLAAKSLMPKVISVSSASNGVSWTAVVLPESPAFDSEMLQGVVEKHTVAKF